MRVSSWPLTAIPPAFIDIVIVMPRSADAGETVQTSNTIRVTAARFMTPILLAAGLATDDDNSEPVAGPPGGRVRGGPPLASGWRLTLFPLRRYGFKERLPPPAYGGPMTPRERVANPLQSARPRTLLQPRAHRKGGTRMTGLSIVLAATLATQAPGESSDSRRLRRSLERQDHRRTGHIRQWRNPDRQEGRRALGRARVALGQLRSR